MKHLEGKTVYLEPTGNNARRKTNEYEVATIVKVARVFVTVNMPWRDEQRFRFLNINGKMCLDGGCNAGWRVYETLEDFKAEKEHWRVSRLIAEKFPYAHSYKGVPLVKLKTIAELLGVEVGNAT